MPLDVVVPSLRGREGRLSPTSHPRLGCMQQTADSQRTAGLGDYYYYQAFFPLLEVTSSSSLASDISWSSSSANNIASTPA